jgi:pimeloyl-ACP methyl ester carboxylesterase
MAKYGPDRKPEFRLDPKTAQLYADVPQDAVERLLDFRRRYPYQEVALHGRTWRYIDTVKGEQVLLVPAGGTTIAEVSFMTIDHLAQRQRVIAPDYPRVDTLAELFSGYIALLDHLGVGRFSLMGGSYGGWMAQSLVRFCPERVDKLVLTAIGPPNPENSRQLAWLLPLLRILPMFLLRALINRTFGRLDSSQRSEPEQALLWALVNEVVTYRIGRADFVAAMRRLIDQTDNYAFSPHDFDDWPGSILILFGDGDPATPPEKRQAMRALYPQAESMTFKGGEHAIALSHQEAYFQAIDEFLAR